MTVDDNMNVPGSGQLNRDDPEWTRRHASSVRLAWVFGAVAVLVFVLALWNLRPF